MDPTDLERAFRAKPALHRFPGNMAKRTQALCAAVAEEYGGDATRIWTGAADGPDLERRLLALPGIGDMKAKALLAILARRFGVELDGMEAVMPTYPTLADVDSAAALATYQERKRAYKQQLKADGRELRCERHRRLRQAVTAGHDRGFPCGSPGCRVDHGGTRIDDRSPQPAGPEDSEPQGLDEVVGAAANGGRIARDEQPSDRAPSGQHLI